MVTFEMNCHRVMVAQNSVSEGMWKQVQIFLSKIKTKRIEK